MLKIESSRMHQSSKMYVYNECKHVHEQHPMRKTYYCNYILPTGARRSSIFSKASALKASYSVPTLTTMLTWPGFACIHFYNMHIHSMWSVVKPAHTQQG